MDSDDSNASRRQWLAAALTGGAAAALGITASPAAETATTEKDSQLASIPPLASEYAFTVSVTLGEVFWVKPTSQGATRGAVYALSGEVSGPHIRGIVLPQSGGDWPLVRPNGVIDFDARYLLKTDDDVLIYMQNRGYRWGSPEVMAAMARHEPVPAGSYYMRTTPKFDAPEGRYDWLSRHVFVGVAEKTPQGNAIHYHKIL
ncbi:MAG TPA: DUF3237 domain-containing protein [Steroidobacteraceae bacterium]|nr:DUF3237 domain-containing protein [Steroidobacteraceae bacterium]